MDVSIAGTTSTSLSLPSSPPPPSSMDTGQTALVHGSTPDVMAVASASGQENEELDSYSSSSPTTSMQSNANNSILAASVAGFGNPFLIQHQLQEASKFFADRQQQQAEGRLSPTGLNTSAPTVVRRWRDR